MTVYISWDVGYGISDKTFFRYPIKCRTPLSQSDIGSSDIRLSPKSLITDIGLSAHLCLLSFTTGQNVYEFGLWIEDVIEYIWCWRQHCLKISSVSNIQKRPFICTILGTIPGCIPQLDPTTNHTPRALKSAVPSHSS